MFFPDGCRDRHGRYEQSSTAHPFRLPLSASGLPFPPEVTRPQMHTRAESDDRSPVQTLFRDFRTSQRYASVLLDRPVVQP